MAAQPPTEQCSAMTQRDTPCKRLVSREGIIPYPNTRIPVPLFCHDHLKSNLVEQRFRCIKYPDVFIIYDGEYSDFGCAAALTNRPIHSVHSVLPGAPHEGAASTGDAKAAYQERFGGVPLRP